MKKMVKCPHCGAKMLHDIVSKGRKSRIYKNYRCPKCNPSKS